MRAVERTLAFAEAQCLQPGGFGRLAGNILTTEPSEPSEPSVASDMKGLSLLDMFSTHESSVFGSTSELLIFPSIILD